MIFNERHYRIKNHTMANPTSAILRAGASLVPSPVTATTSCTWFSFDCIMPFTNVYLSCGDERASTRSFGHILSMSFCCTYENV